MTGNNQSVPKANRQRKLPGFRGQNPAAHAAGSPSQRRRNNENLSNRSPIHDPIRETLSINSSFFRGGYSASCRGKAAGSPQRHGGVGLPPCLADRRRSDEKGWKR